ncbi:MAG: glycosyltransferase family 39 protein, partial [Candidatus Niyogibacteria bacterium]|nr:glycosyltransferase family 39 protein [Candidatus Niyogibacteria bacterium]
MPIRPKKTLLIVLLIIGIAAFFRLFALGTVPPGLYPDEAMNGNNALEALRTHDFKTFYQENNGREGLYINLLAGVLALFGNEIWALRLLPALFGILTVLFTYLFTKELFKNNTVALLAAFFMAISFWHINFSRIGFRAIMAPFFLTSSFYFLLLTLRENISDTKQKLAAAAGGVLFGLGFHSYIAYRIMPLLLIFPALLIWKKQGLSFLGKKGCLWCSFALFIFFMIIAGLPLGMYYLQHPSDFLGRTSQISILDTSSPVKTLITNTFRTIGMFWFAGDGNWRHNFRGQPQLWGPIGLLFVLGIIISIIKLFKNSK